MPVSLSLHRLRRRLHRQLAVGLDRARRLCRGLAELVGRRPHPDEEPSEIAWLRSYSNYLTPSTGLFSADTWTAISLYLRNLILNWLVILPALCLALLGVKGGAVPAFWALAAADHCRCVFVIGPA